MIINGTVFTDTRIVIHTLFQRQCFQIFPICISHAAVLVRQQIAIKIVTGF